MVVLMNVSNDRKPEMKYHNGNVIKRFLSKCISLQNVKVKKPRLSASNSLFCGVVFGILLSFIIVLTRMHERIYQINYHSFNPTFSKNTNLAEFLYQNVRVMCIVMTSDESIAIQGPFIMSTWGKRCNDIIFFSDKSNKDFKNIVVLKETDSFEKLRAALKHVYRNHLDQFDWLFKSFDDSYVVVENLRHLLYQYETDWPLFIGQRYLNEDYMIGDYAISKRALTRVIEHGFTNPRICDKSGRDMDKQISTCMAHVNVIKVDTIDRFGRAYFFQSTPESALYPIKEDGYNEWFWHKPKQGIDGCCSDKLIAIQKCYGDYLWYLEYYIYKVVIFGRTIHQGLPEKLSLLNVIQNNF